MDPFSAFAAAGNVLQFVQVGVNIAGRTVELLKNGGDSQIEDLVALTQQILVSNDHLRQILEKNKTDKRPPGPESALRHSNELCLRISEDFQRFLTSITTTGSMNMWKAVISSFKHLGVREKLNDYHRKLQDARSNLVLSLLLHHVYFSTSHDQYQVLATSTQNHLSKLVQRLSPQPRSFQCDMADLAHLLDTTHVSDQVSDAQGEMPLLASRCRELEQSCIRANRNILSSLQFPEMSDRREAIELAHHGTCSWIFEPGKVAGTIWDSFMQWLMLKDDSNMFWVRGKPGSGKSTLMRWIDGNVEQRIKHELQRSQERIGTTWSEPVGVVIVTYYFWYAGSTIQKSVKGFLRSVLFQLFEANASLIWRCVPTNFWGQTGSKTDDHTIAWKQRELSDSILDILKKLRAERRVLFIIDGLDELDGSDDERVDMITIINKWTSLSHVKVCLASRPWNVYSDLFEKSPQLRLEDLTLQDMRVFTHDQFQSNSRFRQYQTAQPQTAEVIMNEIVSKANGVFLWVRLVIALLLKQLRDGARFQDLITELRRMPDDLEEFFLRMMNSIEPRYRPEAVRLLQMMLFSVSMDAVSATVGGHNTTVIESLNLLLFDTLHLHDQETAFFCLEPGYFESLQNFKANDLEQDVEYDMVIRRINSRSMGLLEVAPLNVSKTRPHHLHGIALKEGAFPNFFKTKVDFIHRTVNEFLLTHAAQTLLGQFTNNKPFTAYGYYCNTLVARLLTVSAIPEASFKSFLKWLVFHLRQNPQHEDQNFDLFEIVMSSDVTQEALAHDRLSDEFATQTEHFTPGQCLSYIYAYEYNWDRYVIHRLRVKHIENAFKRPFLELTLGLFYMDGSSRLNIDFQTTKHVIDLGCEVLSKATKSTILLKYLSSLPYVPEVRSSEATDILYLLISGGAERYFDVSVLKTWPELWRQVGALEDLESAESLCDVIDVMSVMQHRTGNRLFLPHDIDELRQHLDDLSRRMTQSYLVDHEAGSKVLKRKAVEDDNVHPTPWKRQYPTTQESDRIFIDLTEEEED